MTNQNVLEVNLHLMLLFPFFSETAAESSNSHWEHILHEVGCQNCWESPWEVHVDWWH